MTYKKLELNNYHRHIFFQNKFLKNSVNELKIKNCYYKFGKSLEKKSIRNCSEMSSFYQLDKICPFLVSVGPKISLTCDENLPLLGKKVSLFY